MQIGHDTTITYLGHSTFIVDTPGGKRILLEPWVMNNPKCPDNLKQLGNVDLVLISHGHSDHMGDAIQILQQTGATCIGIFEICTWLGSKGIQNTSPMNKGGTQRIGDIKVTMVHAVHSSSVVDDGELIPGGEAAGYVIELENGFKIYHAGDTAVFSDMQLVGELYKPDLCMLPIGDHFTMGPREAAMATKLLGTTQVIPMHYGTFPVLTGTPEEFRNMVGDIGGVQVLDIRPGESLK
ncbi:beta-lactamase domain protein [Thermobaculum terrenum ATCC BAA-798]|uniref:UPF0173 metal-dependent hydrolase Tter_0760 n=1 Tax=Thermobaculum terrenum (strain ATCC BAA-798 / CCMEE 7001 / YNP1) TaxID=525904 RepID=D1CFH1_THET1|nr:metal-dependent hydrolase [Thermobaculum terrenum]ACZ41677.1 beta-lactamase domain protein [Thermobaculum terrenum ATCC BAA-798]